MKKKIISVIAAACLLISVFVVSASAASVSVSGPSSVQSGSTVTYSVTVTDSSGMTGFSANIGADSGVTVKSVSGGQSGWLNTSNNNNIAVAGANSTTRLTFRIECSVSGSVGEGKRVYLSNINVSDSNGSDSSLANVQSNAVSIAPAPSGDATLSRLTVANAKMSPAFSPNRTSYSCGTVGFEVAKLSVSATARDSGAKVSVQGTNLSVGDNTVRVVVTAANGTKKTYSINVTREQDPNYVPSKNTQLSGITLSAGQLSPEFAAETKEYVVYVPFEVSKISITSAAADPLAKGVENVEDAELKVGLNKLITKCVAEDGTEGIYKINVVRMTKFESLESIVTPTTKAPEDSAQNVEQKTEYKNGVSPVLLAVLSVVCIVLGLAIGIVIMRHKNAKKVTGTDNTDDFDKLV